MLTLLTFHQHTLRLPAAPIPYNPLIISPAYPSLQSTLHTRRRSRPHRPNDVLQYIRVYATLRLTA
jgi:hypothetical protein